MARLMRGTWPPQGRAAAKRAEPKISEAEFQQQVIDLARMLGWRVAHFRPARTADGRWVTPVAADGKGFPDLVLAKHGTVVLAELKSDTGVLSQEQRDWVHASGAQVWRPGDLDLIRQYLRQRAR